MFILVICCGYIALITQKKKKKIPGSLSVILI